MIPWRRKNKARKDPELVQAEQKVNELSKRAERIVRDNHLVIDIKKALGAR
jgi:hypothetical protein